MRSNESRVLVISDTIAPIRDQHHWVLLRQHVRLNPRQMDPYDCWVLHIQDPHYLSYLGVLLVMGARQGKRILVHQTRLISASYWSTLIRSRVQALYRQCHAQT